MCAHAGFLTDIHVGHSGHRHRLLTNLNTALAEVVTELVDFAAVKFSGLTLTCFQSRSLAHAD